ncbi:hypothetical protein JCM6882_008496 [Rhodosporidiobolus microsporus]
MPHRGRRPKKSPSTTSGSSKPPPPLPVELIDLIFGHLPQGAEFEAPILARCCLVSRTFLDLPRSHLYRNAHLVLSLTNLPNMVRWHSSSVSGLFVAVQSNPRLGQLVRQLAIVHCDEDSVITTMKFASLLTVVLRSCRMITAIAIDEPFLAHFQGILQTDTVRSALAHLEGIQIDSTSDLAWALLEALPRETLRHLRIDVHEPALPTHRTPLPPVPNLCLKTLAVSGSAEPHVPFLKNLFPCIASTLTHMLLDLDAIDGFPCLEALPQLQELRICVPDGDLKRTFFACLPPLIKSCKRLKTLKMYSRTLTLSNVLTLTSAEPTGLAAHLPSSIVFLRLPAPYFHPLDLVRFITAVPQAARLRRIEVGAYELPLGRRDRKKRPEMPTEEEKEELRKVCKRRGIEVVELDNWCR